MRHDPASGAIVVMLRSLKMHGMAQAVTDLMAQGSPAFEAAVPMLSQLLKAETAEREVRSVAYQLKVARFPAYRDLAGFDFASSEINEALVANPSTANADPYGEGWLIVLKPEDWAGVKPSLVPGAQVAGPYEAKMAADGFAGCA